jgi:hypothetical protein
MDMTPCAHLQYPRVTVESNDTPSRSAVGECEVKKGNERHA